MLGGVHMKVIFLDIDGVLNSGAWYVKRPSDGRWPISHLDPDAVKVLNEIIEKTGAVVVVSSTWRIGQGRTWLQEVLTTAGFTGTVVGKTTVLDEKERGHEIQEWLDNVAPMYARRNDPVSHFVILDDDTDMAHLRSKLVHINHDAGLTHKYVEEILNHLGGAYER